MNIELRKIIYQFPLLHRICMSIVDFNNGMFYKKYTKVNKQDEKIKSMYKSEMGNRCFIVGNGPSLCVEDLELIKDEKCFAANLIFKIFDKTDWRPTYYFLQDRYADTQGIVDTMNVKHLFIGAYYWRKRGMKNPNALCMRVKRNFNTDIPLFSEDISREVYDMKTVTYSMIQVAVYLGFSEIYLLGMDHSYALTYDSTGKVKKDNDVISHFFDDKNPNEVIANVEAMNMAYIAARDYAKEHGIKIVNVTRGGKLDWFPRKNLEDVLN